MPVNILKLQLQLDDFCRKIIKNAAPASAGTNSLDPKLVENHVATLVRWIISKKEHSNYT